MKKWFFFLAVFYSLFQLQAYDFAWSSPQTLSSEGVDAEDPQIVTDSNGNTTLIWLESGVVQTNVQPFGGAWAESPQALSGSGASAPKLAVDGSGNATAVWLESGLVKTASLPLSGAWSEVTTLSDAGASQPQLAVDSTGNKLVVWERDGFIEAITFTSDAWSLVSMLSAANSDFPKAALSEDGTAIVVWHNSSNPGNPSSIEAVYSTTSTIGGSWQTPKLITSTSVNASHPDVTIDGSGNATAVWFQYEKPLETYTNVQVLGSRLAKNATSWGASEEISVKGFRDPGSLSLKVRADARGNLISLWNLSTDGTVFSVQSNLKQVGSSWNSPSDLVAQSYFALSADVAVSPQGQALAACMFSEQNNTNTIQIFVDDTYIGGYAINFWAIPSYPALGTNNGYPRVTASSDSSQIYGAVTWLSSNGTNNELQVITGTKQILLPPSNLVLTQESTSYGVFTNYSNKVTWDPSPSPNVVSYVIYRNGIYVTRVEDGSATYTDFNNVPDTSVTYGVAALDTQQAQSETITVSTP